MNKNQKILLWGGVAVFALMALMIVLLLTSNNKQADAADEAQARADSLALANDRLQLTQEFDQLNADFSQYEDQQVYLQNDSLVQQYNQARMKVEGLLRELNNEKANNSKNRARIKQLENEIASLKKIVRHYLEEIKRLGEENEGLKKEIEVVNQRNEQLTSRAETVERDNAQLTQTVAKAKKLSLSGLSFAAYNKKGKGEKKISKATSLGASFTINPNNTAAAGQKTLYLRVVSPDGTLIGGGPSFSYDGASLQSSASKTIEYDNGEVHVTIYCQVNTTLTAGDYTVEVFCDGSRLGSKHFNMSN